MPASDDPVARQRRTGALYRLDQAMQEALSVMEAGLVAVACGVLLEDRAGLTGMVTAMKDAVKMQGMDL